MARRMRLVELGTKRGRLNEPATNSDTLDEGENRIITEIETEKRRAFDEATSHLRAVRERFAALQLDGLIAKVGVTTDASVANLSAAVVAGKDRLHALRTAAIEHEGALRQFQQAHRLRRPPSYPRSRVLHIGILASLALVESLANAFLIAIGHQQGLLGGLVIAVIISALNVGGGVFAGLAIVRNLVHRSTLRKMLGVAGCCGYAAFVLVFNLLVAHYRDAFAVDPGNQAATLALDSFRAAPFHLQSVTGWLLLLMGCSFAAIATYDGFMLDDQYPGYGRLARLSDEAKRDYIDEKEDILSNISAIRDAGIRAPFDTLAEIELRRTQHESIVAQQRKLVDSYHQHIRYLEQCANDLLSTYRDANRAARTDKPPARFSRRMSLQPTQLAFEVVVEDAAVVADLRRTLSHILEGHRDTLRGEYQAALVAFDLVEALDQGASDRARAV